MRSRKKLLFDQGKRTGLRPHQICPSITNWANAVGNSAAWRDEKKGLKSAPAHPFLRDDLEDVTPSTTRRKPRVPIQTLEYAERGRISSNSPNCFASFAATARIVRGPFSREFNTRGSTADYDFWRMFARGNTRGPARTVLHKEPLTYEEVHYESQGSISSQAMN